VFVRGGDYCFREKTERQDVDRETRREGNERREKISSIITSFHFDALDVRTKMVELPPTAKGFDGTDCNDR